MPDRKPKLMEPHRRFERGDEAAVVIRIAYEGLKGDQYDTLEMSPDDAIEYAMRLLMVAFTEKGGRL